MYQYLTVEEAYRITNDLGICLVCDGDNQCVYWELEDE
ncbi:hypothetical protein [Salmonella phage GSP003]|nr:hypothetical protein [Salmonella phage GSP003]